MAELRYGRKKKLVEPDAQDIAVHYGDALNRPIRCRFFNYIVKRFLFLQNIQNQFLHKRKISHTGSKFLYVALKNFVNRFSRCAFFRLNLTAVKIPLKERLHSY